MQQSTHITDPVHNCVAAFCEAVKHHDAYSARKYCSETAWGGPNPICGKALYRQIKRHKFRYNCASQVHEEGERAWVLLYGYSGTADFAFHRFALVENENNEAHITGFTDSETHARRFLTGEIGPVVYLSALTTDDGVETWAQQQAHLLAEAVLRTTADLPIDAPVTHIPEFGGKFSLSKALSKRYRSKYTTLTDEFFAHRQRILVFTSATAENGKSATVLGAAGSLAESGARTLVIDADLHNPQISRSIKGLDGAVGFADWIMADQLEPTKIHSHRSGVDIMTSGSAEIEPETVFAAPWLTAKLVQLRETYDYILIDTSPCLHNNEARSICGADSASVDSTIAPFGVIFVTDHAAVPELLVRQSLEQIRSTRTPIVTIAVNRYDPKNSDSRLQVEVERTYFLEGIERAGIEFRIRRKEAGVGQTHWLMANREPKNVYRPVGLSAGMTLETFLSGGRPLK
jgi:Mrp family chromosome partitioning ATPase